jgi:hypothetical protein
MRIVSGRSSDRKSLRSSIPHVNGSRRAASCVLSNAVHENIRSVRTKSGQPKLSLSDFVQLLKVGKNLSLLAVYFREYVTLSARAVASIYPDCRCSRSHRVRQPGCGCEVIPSAYHPQTSWLPTNSTLICRLSFCARGADSIAPRVSCADNGHYPCTWKAAWPRQSEPGADAMGGRLHTLVQSHATFCAMGSSSSQS